MQNDAAVFRTQETLAHGKAKIDQVFASFAEVGIKASADPHPTAAALSPRVTTRAAARGARPRLRGVPWHTRACRR